MLQIDTKPVGTGFQARPMSLNHFAVRCPNVRRISCVNLAGFKVAKQRVTRERQIGFIRVINLTQPHIVTT